MIRQNAHKLASGIACRSDNTYLNHLFLFPSARDIKITLCCNHTTFFINVYYFFRIFMHLIACFIHFYAYYTLFYALIKIFYSYFHLHLHFFCCIVFSDETFENFMEVIL